MMERKKIDEVDKRQRIAEARAELEHLRENYIDRKTGKRIISDHEDDRANHLCAMLVKEQGIVFDQAIRKQVVAELVEEFSYLRNGGREKCKD